MISESYKQIYLKKNKYISDIEFQKISKLAKEADPPEELRSTVQRMVELFKEQEEKFIEEKTLLKSLHSAFNASFLKKKNQRSLKLIYEIFLMIEYISLHLFDKK